MNGRLRTAYFNEPKEKQNPMARDTITWNEFYGALEAQGIETDLKGKLVNMLKTVQDLGPTEEVKLCKNLTQDDISKDVWLNDRRLTGTLYDFNEEGENFYLVIDFKMHKFTPESIIVLKKAFKGSDTLIDG